MGLQRGHREFLVAVRREGQFVGEMAAFASAALRCASVRARGPVRAKIVPGELLRACVERVPEVGTCLCTNRRPAFQVYQESGCMKPAAVSSCPGPGPMLALI